jgi:hypothetical protein
MRLEIELRCILFLLIILEMFLQLDWSSPVVSSIDRRVTFQIRPKLYKVAQLTEHVRACQCMSEHVRACQSSEIGLCQGTYLRKGTKTFEGPKVHSGLYHS